MENGSGSRTDRQLLEEEMRGWKGKAYELVEQEPHVKAR